MQARTTEKNLAARLGESLVPVCMAIGMLALLASPASARNIALLIGNSNYAAIGQLDNPANDARDLAATLNAIGFETIVRLDADALAMKSIIRDFGERLKDNDGIGLFFFAGHGVQVNGENFLIPTGYPFRNEQDVENHAVPANMVLRYMEDSKNRVNVVVLDACRNNPFIKTRSVKARGLAPMDAPSGSLVAFSTAPGTEASDGSGRNGLYTKHLMANIKMPGLTVEQVFKRTREGVENESEREIGRKQSPREESSLKGGDMYFVAPPAAGSANDPAAVELAYWNSIAASGNPVDFETYLAQYPNGRFAALARNRLESARRSASSPAESRTVGEGASTAAPRPTLAKSGTGVYSSSGFSFSDREGAVKAAEFLSISCRDSIRNKRVRVEIAEKGSSGMPFRQAMERKLENAGVRIAAAGSGADLIVKGVIETSAGVNRMVGLNEVEMDGEFALRSPGGKTFASTTMSGGAFAGSNLKSAARDVWEERSEEVVGKLLRDYCAGR